jgi:hypothetical protein
MYTNGGFTLKFLVMVLRRQQSHQLMSRHAEDDLVMAVTITQLVQIEEEEEPCWGGSVLGRRIVPRNRFSGYRLLYADYFVDEPVFNDDVFRPRFVFIHCIFSHLINDK